MITAEDFLKNPTEKVAKEVLEKLDISYFLIDESDTLIGFIQDRYPELIKENINKIIHFISTFGDKEIQLLTTHNGYTTESTITNWLNELISMVHYTISYPEIFDICEWGDTHNGYVPTGLKNPFYPFEELTPLIKLKDALNINEDLFFNELHAVIYDYATYSVGSYNNEYREEFMSVYEDYMLPILKGNKVVSDVLNKIQILKRYEKILKEYNSRKQILSLLNVNETVKSSNDLKIEYVKMVQENEEKLKQVPQKYRNIEIIVEELRQLSLSKKGK